MKAERLMPNNHEVPMDYFFYSCFEFENLLKAKRSQLRSEFRWLTGHEEKLQKATQDALELLLEESARWYLEQYQVLGDGESISFGSISEFSKAVVFLVLDFEAITLACLGRSLAPISSDTLETDSAWRAISLTVERTFPNYKVYMLSFLEWKHRNPVVEEIPVGSRPPVGRHSPFFRAGRFDGARSRTSTKRGNHSSSYVASRPDGSKSLPKQSNDERPNARETTHPRKRDRDPQLEQESLNEVLKGIEYLQQNPSLQQFKLAPANSYYRRLQHQHAKDNGMYSISTGEGSERAVVIVREESSGKNSDD